MQRRWSESEIDEVWSSCFNSDYKQGRHASIPEVPKMLKNSICSLWFEYVKKKQQQQQKNKKNLENKVGIGLK